MGKTKLCPECGVENPVSRVTCIACKVPLYAKAKGKSPGPDSSGPDPFTGGKTEEKSDKPAEKPTTKPKEKSTEKAGVGSTQAKKTEEPSLNPKAVDQVKKVIRRRRRVKVEPKQEEGFLLSGMNLIPVKIGMKIVKVQPKNLTEEAKALIRLWSRNKKIINIG